MIDDLISRDLVSGDLRISATDDSDAKVLSFVFKGKSNARDPSKVLGPYFLDRVLPEAASAERSLELRFDELEYLNSSTIGALLQVLTACRKAKQRVSVVYKEQADWQRVTFGAFRALAKRDELLTLKGV